MKRPLVIIVMAAVMGCIGTVLAEEPQDQPWQKRAVLRAGQEIQGDYFAFGPHVEISGTVHGDVYAAGGDVLVDGEVEGDLLVAGGQVTVSGTVAQDARIAGGQVTISGTIGRNVTVAGGNVQLTDSARVQGNLLAGAGHLHVAGGIARDARVGAGSVMVSTTIGGDLAVAATDIRLTSTASVGKNFRYWSEDEPSIDEGATVGGSVSRREVPEPLRSEPYRRGYMGMKLAAGIISAVSTLLLGLLLVRIYPVFSQRTADTIQQRPGTSLIVGVGFMLFVPLLALLCLVTVVGIPIGLLLGLLYVATLYVGRVFVLLWAGQWILRSFSLSSSADRGLVTGLILYGLLSLLPLIGTLVMLTTLAAGLGALLIAKTELVTSLRQERMV